jgi:TPR repeat protein
MHRRQPKEVGFELKKLLLAWALSLLLATPVLPASSPKLSEAFRDWKADAENGDARAQYFLGLAFVAGRGTYPDYEEAYKWFAIAAASAESYAEESRRRIARRMTADRIRKAERRAREWLAKHHRPVK